MIMLITRIWDAINDPMLGAIAERTHTRWGRFRPYLLFGAPVLAIATGFTFMSPNFSVMGKNIYALITYTTVSYTHLKSNRKINTIFRRHIERRHL